MEPSSRAWFPTSEDDDRDTPGRDWVGNQSRAGQSSSGSATRRARTIHLSSTPRILLHLLSSFHPAQVGASCGLWFGLCHDFKLGPGFPPPHPTGLTSPTKQPDMPFSWALNDATSDLRPVSVLHVEGDVLGLAFVVPQAFYSAGLWFCSCPAWGCCTLLFWLPRTFLPRCWHA